MHLSSVCRKLSSISSPNSSPIYKFPWGQKLRTQQSCRGHICCVFPGSLWEVLMVIFLTTSKTLVRRVGRSAIEEQ
jgi:hypothetical protein